jgi:hypothetical protein
VAIKLAARLNGYVMGVSLLMLLVISLFGEQIIIMVLAAANRPRSRAGAVPARNICAALTWTEIKMLEIASGQDQMPPREKRTAYLRYLMYAGLPLAISSIFISVQAPGRCPPGTSAPL